jgi:riboflavin kinase / FMN adenylyltransferase
MQFFRSIPAQSQMSSVLTIGNFDGVHQGHRALLRRLTEKARQVALPATVLSFEPHPREFFAPDQAPARLSSLREKLTLLEECGVDQFYVCRFNQKFADLTATSFIEQVLVRGLSVRHILIGDDFRFGRARMGDFSLLQQAGEQHRFTVEAMDTLSVDDIRASSSAVRRALAAGDLVLATRLLGRPYAIAGKVMHGQKLGRTLGFPTANLALKHKTLPFSGVFAVTVSGIGPENILGAASLGVRPTVADGLKPVLEVHLLDFDGDIYGRHVSVNFLHKLRDEEKYTSLELLTAQIERDVAAVRDFFRSTATA